MSDPADPRVPPNSLIFGYGPMLPLVAAAIGAWTLPRDWPVIAVRLAVIWAALLLCFVAGVRRGFGFGNPRASTPAEIGAMLVYFILAGLALVAPYSWQALPLLLVGYVLVAVLDPVAARRGDAPAHFARLRPPQMAIGAAALAGLWARIMLV